MAWTPISNTVPQYEEDGVAASGFYIKFYEAGTTTPTAMATDSTGATTLDKCELNTEGYPKNGSNAVFIPHIDRRYKIALFRNATDADNNNLNNAVWPVDNLSPFKTDDSVIQTQIDTIALLRDFEPIIDGQQISLLGHTLAGIGGGEFYYDVSDTTSADNNGTIIVTAGGKRWKRPAEIFVTPEMFGAQGDGITNDTIAIQSSMDYIASFGGGTVYLTAEKEYKANNLAIRIGVVLSSDGSHNKGSEFLTTLTAFDSGEPVFIMDSPDTYRNFGWVGLEIKGGTYGILMDYIGYNVAVRDCKINGSIAGFSVGRAIERSDFSNVEFGGGNSTGNGFQITNDGDTEFNYMDKTNFDMCRFTGVNGVYIDTARVCNSVTFNSPVFNGCRKEAFVNVGSATQFLINNAVTELNGLDGGNSSFIRAINGSFASGAFTVNIGAFTPGLASVGDEVTISRAGLYGNNLSTTISGVDPAAGNITLTDAISANLVGGERCVISFKLYDEYVLGGMSSSTFNTSTFIGSGSIRYGVSGGFINTFINSQGINPVYDPTWSNNYVGCHSLSVDRITDPNRAGNSYLRLQSPVRDTSILPTVYPGQAKGKGAVISLVGSGSNNNTGPFGAFKVARTDPNKSIIFAVDDDNDKAGPTRDDEMTAGALGQRYSAGYIKDLKPGAGTVTWTSGEGTPEGSYSATVGSMYTRTNGGASSTLYVKESGTGNTGWVAK